MKSVLEPAIGTNDVVTSNDNETSHSLYQEEMKVVTVSLIDEPKASESDEFLNMVE